jgi:tRNA-2-methylthio-N6-dimethylallyladenosine synthase
MAESSKICHHLHLPLQSGSSRLLKRMNRHYSKESYLELVEKLREKIPDLSLTTDIIVGFPGETEEDFEETLDIARTVEYDSAFTFIYSPREGTPAARLFNDMIPDDVCHERFDRLVDVMNTISLEKNLGYKGRVCDVMVEGRSKNEPDTYAGRTDGFKLVNFSSDRSEEEMIGNTVRVLITESKTFSLEGRELTDEELQDEKLANIKPADV